MIDKYPAREGAGLKGERMKNTHEVNSVCKMCNNDCKQAASVKVVSCPMFEAEKQKVEDAHGIPIIYDEYSDVDLDGIEDVIQMLKEHKKNRLTRLKNRDTLSGSTSTRGEHAGTDMADKGR